MEDKLYTRMPKFIGSKDDDFQLWSLKLKAALKSKGLVDAIADPGAELDKSEKALTINICGHRDNPLRMTQDCESAHDAWEKLQTRYAGKTMINMQSNLQTLFNMRLKRGDEMGNHIAKLKS